MAFNYPAIIQTLIAGTVTSIGTPANGLSIASTVLSLATATGSVPGALSAADWTTFNSKQAALTLGNLTSPTTGVTIGSGTGVVVGSGTTVSIQSASTSQPGLLTSADWNTFNGKQSALTIGNLTAAGTDGIVVTSGTGAVIGSGTSLAQHVADASHNGYLTSTDWSTFNSKQAAITTGTTAQYLRGDLSLSTFITDARTSISASSPLSYNNSTGVLTLPVINFTNTVVTNFQDGQDPTQGYNIYEEWDNSATTGRLNWSKTVVATGTDSLSGDGNHPGIQQMKVSAVSDSIVLNLSGATVVFGGGVYTFQCNARFPTLSTNVDEYIGKIGMNNAGAVTTEGTNLVYFSYDRATDGNFFAICTRGGGTKQKTVSSLAVVANTWYTLRFIVNAGGTSVDFYGAISGSALALLGTISTQVPTTGLAAFMNLLKTVGSSQRSFENDYVLGKCTFTTAR